MSHLLLTEAYSEKGFNLRGAFVCCNEASGTITYRKSSESSEIDVGKNPRNVTLDPEGLFAYVSLSGEDKIAKVDLKNHKTVDVIDVPGEPRSLKFFDQNHRVAVVTKNDDSINFIDLRTKQVEKQRVCKGPRDLVIDEPRNLAVISCNGEGKVVGVNLSTKEPNFQIDVPSQPYGLFIHENRLFGTSIGENVVFEVDLEKKKLNRIHKVGKHPTSIVRFEDTLYISNFESPYLSTISLVTQEVGKVKSSEALFDLAMLSGHIFATNNENNFVEIYAPSGKKVAQAPSGKEPHGIETTL